MKLIESFGTSPLATVASATSSRGARAITSVGFADIAPAGTPGGPNQKRPARRRAVIG